jgi:hypothetical protein
MATTTIAVSTKIMTGMWIYHSAGRIWWPHTYRENTCVCDIIAHIAPVHPTITLYAIPGHVLRWYDKVSANIFGVLCDTLIVNVRGRIIPVAKHTVIKDILSACIASSLVSPWVCDARITGLETIDALSGEKVLLDKDMKHPGCVLYAQWADTGVVLDEAVFSVTPIQQNDFIHSSDIDYFKFACRTRHIKNRKRRACSQLGTVCVLFSQDDPFYSVPVSDSYIREGVRFRLRRATLFNGQSIIYSSKSKKLKFTGHRNKVCVKLSFNTPLQYKSCTYQLYLV